MNTLSLKERLEKIQEDQFKLRTAQIDVARETEELIRDLVEKDPNLATQVLTLNTRKLIRLLR